MISIIPFEERYTQDVIDLVLHFQNDGTRPMVTVDDQPDLRNIVDSYIHAGGNFWIAVENDRLIGSIGIMPCNQDIAILKKFFVYEAYQGAPFILDRNYMLRYCNLQKKTGSKHSCWIPPIIPFAHINFMKKQDFKK